MAALPFSGLRVRLLLLVLLALLPAASVILFAAWEERQRATAGVREDARQLAELLAANHDRLIEGARQLLIGLARLPEVRNGDRAACGRLFADLLRQYRSYANLGVAAATGAVWCSAVPMAGPVSAADRAYVREALTTRRFAVGRYQVDRITGKPALNFGQPVVDEAGRVQAVVFAALDLIWLTDLARQAQLPPGSTVTVLDRDGLILARDPPGPWVGQRTLDAALVQAILAERHGSAEARGLDGVPRLYGFTPLGRDPEVQTVYLAVGMPRSGAYAAVYWMLRRNLLILGLMAVVVLTLTRVFAHRFLLRPAEALVRAARGLAQGDRGARTGFPHGVGEFGQLARAFDEMAQVLEGRTEDVERAVEALRRSEQAFRALVEHAQDAITVLDAQGRIRYQSPASERILGYRPEALIGRPVTEFIHPEDLDVVRQAAAEAQARPGEPTTREFRVRHTDGTWRVVEGTGQDLRTDPVVQGVIAHARDVTARRQAEETLRARDEHIRQLQKLEAVGQLAGGVAHDFNNLLTVITGRSQLLLDSATLPAPIRKNIEQIRKTAERAAALTRQLLAFSRKQVLAPRVLSLNTVVPDLTAMLKRLIREDIDLVFHPGAELSRVKADPGQLEQVIMNLVLNARDAMPEGGRIIVETVNVELSETYARQHVGVQAGPYVMLAVSDTGTGMDAATQARIFEPFFTTKAPGKGTGLGLSTVYGIVKQSGGNVWVYSELGHGTTFKIYLPRVEDAEQVAEAPQGRPGGGTETVLLVEDEDELRLLAREILTGHGYTVFEARQPSEALLVAERHTGPINLLVTDVVLPEISGRVLADRLRPLRPEMRVLYMSGYPDHAIVHQGRLDPGTPFIQKPFTPEALARSVRSVLDAVELG